MILDIRFVSGDSVESIIKDIKKIDKEVNVKVLIEGMCFISDVKNKYVKSFIKASEKVLDKKITKTYSEGTSDAIYFSSKGMPTVIMNPIGDYPHCPKEYVNKESLLTLYKIIEEFINETM